MNPKDKVFLYSTLFSTALIAAVSVMIATAANLGAEKIRERINYRMVQSGDLNRDGIADIVQIGEFGHKTPYYGKNDGTNISYITAEAMQRSNPKDYFNYGKLEQDLNAKKIQ